MGDYSAIYKDHSNDAAILRQWARISQPWLLDIALKNRENPKAVRFMNAVAAYQKNLIILLNDRSKTSADLAESHAEALDAHERSDPRDEKMCLEDHLDLLDTELQILRADSSPASILLLGRMLDAAYQYSLSRMPQPGPQPD